MKIWQSFEIKFRISCAQFDCKIIESVESRIRTLGNFDGDADDVRPDEKIFFNCPCISSAQLKFASEKSIVDPTLRIIKHLMYLPLNNRELFAQVSNPLLYHCRWRISFSFHFLLCRERELRTENKTAVEVVLQPLKHFVTDSSSIWRQASFTIVK